VEKNQELTRQRDVLQVRVRELTSKIMEVKSQLFQYQDSESPDEQRGGCIIKEKLCAIGR
jgi:hypothetical protein